MPKRPSFARSSARLASSGGRELTELRRALHAAESDLAGLHRMLRVAAPKGGARTIKGSRDATSPMDRLGRNVLTHLADDALKTGDIAIDSFAPSGAQTAATLLDLIAKGQRVW